MLIRLVAFNARFVHSAPALFYLRELLERNLPQARVELRQFTINDPYYDTLLQVLAQAPEEKERREVDGGRTFARKDTPPCDRIPMALFFSAYVWNAAYLRRLIPDLRRLRGDIPLVLGGPQAPHLNLPDDCRHTVVTGPAEGLGAEFYRDLAAGSLRPGYRAYGRAPFAMPYRHEDFQDQLGNRHLYYESARGCPFACSYCLSAGRRGVEYRELSRVLEELEGLLVWGAEVIRFVDRTFNAPPERARVIWSFLIDRAKRVREEQPDCKLPRFHFEIAPDFFDEQGLELLTTAPPGLFHFEIGLQSFNLASLAAVNRNPDLELAQKNIRRLLAADNIHLHLDLILGLPFETESSYLRSLNAVLALRPHHLQLGLLKVLPDTPLAGRKREFGLIAGGEAPYPVLATRWLPQPLLAKLYHAGELIESCYNPRYFLATMDYLLAREPDPAAFFLGFSLSFQREGFQGLARTQELLSRALAHYFSSRHDAALALELLRFDWLACGHRHLPQHLLVGFSENFSAENPLPENLLKEAQDLLWRHLPEEYLPYYTPHQRSGFFKRSLFAPFSAAALKQLGFGAGQRDGGVVAFLERETPGLKARRTTALFPLPQKIVKGG